METLKKRMCIGMEKRDGWEVKLRLALQSVVGAVGVQLSDEEIARLAAMPAEVSNLIYAGQMRSFVLEFAGEACEVVLEYYPQEDEQDDLDLSLLDAVDWGDVDALTVRVLVEDQAYAESIVGPALMSFRSEKLTVRIEQAGGGEPEPADTGDEGTSMGKVKQKEQDEEERKEAD